MYMVDVKNRFGVEQLRNMGCGYAPRSQYWPLKSVENDSNDITQIPKIPIICNLSWVSNNDVNVIMVIGILPDVNCFKTFQLEQPHSLLQKLCCGITLIR